MVGVGGLTNSFVFQKKPHGNYMLQHKPKFVHHNNSNLINLSHYAHLQIRLETPTFCLELSAQRGDWGKIISSSTYLG